MKLSVIPTTDRRPTTIDDARREAAEWSAKARQAALDKNEADARWQQREQISADALTDALIAGKTEPKNVAAALTAERDRTRERHAALVELEKRAHAKAAATLKAEVSTWAKAEQEDADTKTAKALEVFLVFYADLKVAQEANAVAEWATLAGRGQVLDYAGGTSWGAPNLLEQVKGLLGITAKEMAEQNRKINVRAAELKAQAEAEAQAEDQRRQASYAAQAAARVAMPRKAARAWKQVGV